MSGPDLAASTRRVNYVAAAGQTAFPFSFPISAAADLDVVRTRGNAAVTLTLATDYSVAIGPTGTGTVTLATGALAGDGIAVVGATAIERTVAYQTGGDLFATTLNTDIRKAYVILQELGTRIERVLSLAPGDPTASLALPPATARAGRLLAFDASGRPAAYDPAILPARITVSASPPTGGGADGDIWFQTP